MRYDDPTCIKRYPANPIISPKDVPYPCDRVYNPAACRFGDRYALVLRIDQDHNASWPKQFLGLAFSDDGYHFEVEPEPMLLPSPEEFGHLNDPRLTFIDGWYILTYCSDPDGPGLREEGIYLCIDRYEMPLLNPVEPCDMDPYYRPNVVFPCGIIEEPDGQLKIYYGASDTHIALATAHRDEHVELCLQGGRQN